MDGVFGLIVLVILITANYFFISNLTSNLKNRKLRSLIMSIANFVLVMLFVFCLPLVGGYSYDGIQDVVKVLFDEETAPLLVITIIGFIAAIFYFGVGAYLIWQEETTLKKIKLFQEEISYLEKKLQGATHTIHLLNLLSACDESALTIINNPKVKVARACEQQIRQNYQQIKKLQERLMQYRQ